MGGFDYTELGRAFGQELSEDYRSLVGEVVREAAREVVREVADSFRLRLEVERRVFGEVVARALQDHGIARS